MYQSIFSIVVILNFFLILFFSHRKWYLQFQLYKKVYPRTYKDYNMFQVLVLYKLGFTEPVLYAFPIYISFSNDAFYHNKNEEEIIEIKKRLKKLYTNNIFFILCFTFHLSIVFFF